MYGQLYRDQVSLGSAIQIPEQGFAVINGMTPFEEPPCVNQWDGYLGLAPAKQGITGEGQVEHFATVIQHLHEALPHPIFALHLTTEKNAPAHLILGGVDRSLYSDCLVWHDVEPLEMEDGRDADILWNLQVQASYVGDYSLPSVDFAILDSSVAEITGPAYAVAALVEHTDGWFCGAQDEFDYSIQNVSCYHSPFEFAFGPCNSPVEPLTIQVNDTKYIITDLVIPLDEDEVVNVDDSDVDEWCFLMVLPNDELPGWLMGQPFFYNYFVALDFQRNKVGLASMRTAEDKDAPLCPEEAFLDIHNNAATNNTFIPTLAPSTGNGSDSTQAPSQGENTESSEPVPAETNVPTQEPFSSRSGAPQDATADTAIPTPGPVVVTEVPIPDPTMAPHREAIPPHSLPHPPTLPPYSSSQSPESASTIVPIVLGAAVLAFLVFCLMKRRERQGRYRRAAWSDGYTMGGDLELRAIS